MSNQKKAEFINGNFGIQCLWGGHGEISPRSGLVLKGTICPEISNSATDKFPISLTCKPLAFWSHEANHRKAEQVTYRVGIEKSGSFRLA
jgi:hypothetical protein